MKQQKWISKKKSAFCFLLLLAITVSLCGCMIDEQNAGTLSNTETTQEPTETTTLTTDPIETAIQPTEPVETQTQATEPTETVTVPTKPLHSDLYLPECTQEQMLAYFSEVVLSMEYSSGDGDATLVQKWTVPICYRIFGIPTDEDMAVLNALIEQLNGIPGFPGMYAAEDGMQENFTISFLHQEDFNASFSDAVNGEYAFGAAQFWYYTATNDIYTGRVGCSADIDQSVRNSVIQEEIVNALGLNDTVLREDSIVYQYSDENTSLSDVDMVILQLLFHPDIRCGMDYESCRSVIEKLYY